MFTSKITLAPRGTKKAQKLTSIPLSENTVKRGCSGAGWELQVPWRPHHQQTNMVQAHHDSREEGTTKTYSPSGDWNNGYMGSEQDHVLFHTEAWWLSRGSVGKIFCIERGTVVIHNGRALWNLLPNLFDCDMAVNEIEQLLELSYDRMHSWDTTEEIWFLTPREYPAICLWALINAAFKTTGNSEISDFSAFKIIGKEN